MKRPFSTISPKSRFIFFYHFPSKKMNPPFPDKTVSRANRSIKKQTCFFISAFNLPVKPQRLRLFLLIFLLCDPKDLRRILRLIQEVYVGHMVSLGIQAFCPFKNLRLLTFSFFVAIVKYYGYDASLFHSP